MPRRRGRRGAARTAHRSRTARRAPSGRTTKRDGSRASERRGAASRSEGLLQARDEHAVDALDHLPGLLRLHAARFEGAAPVDRRAATTEVPEPYGRDVVGEGKGALQHRVRERMRSWIVGLEALANRRGPIVANGAHGADAPSLDGYPGPPGRPRAQVAEVGKARPYPLDRRVDLIANPGGRHREPPSCGPMRLDVRARSRSKRCSRVVEPWAAPGRPRIGRPRGSWRQAPAAC